MFFPSCNGLQFKWAGTRLDRCPGPFELQAITNSAFRQWYLRNVSNRTESELKTAIKKFSQFLDQEKGLRNEAVLKSFQR